MSELRPWLRLMLTRRNRLLIGALLMAATLLAGVGLLSLSGWFITATAVTSLAWAAGAAATLDVYVPGGGIRFFALTRTVARYGERLYNHDTVLRLLADLRVSAFRSLSQLDGQTQSRYQASQWLNRLTRDIDTLDNLYLRLLAPPLVALLGVGLVAVFMALFFPGAAWPVAILLLVVLLLLTLGMACWGRALSDRQVVQTDHLRVRAVEQLQGLAELQAWQVLPEHQRGLLALEHNQSRDRRRLEERGALGQGLAVGGVQGAVALTLVLTLEAYQQGLISGPVMVMLPLAVMALAEGFTALPGAFVHWGSSEAAARRLNEQQALTGRLPVAPESQSVVSLAAMEWQGVTVLLGTTPVFRGLNLTLGPEEKLAVVGPSGAGKSTLAALAARLIDPDQGQVCWGGASLTTLDEAQWRRQVAVLTQDAHLFNDTLAANLRLAAPMASDGELWAVLEKVNLKQQVLGFAQGLNTPIGEFGRQLSGGEARRVALARLFLRDPVLVILDEPLTGLDPATAAIVRHHLNDFLQRRGALLLAHDPEALPAADRTLVLSSQGKLAPFHR
ncbi:MAG: thiol reductant ABC exporter subunit CydC [Halomonadaceae bacterium]|nr:MAG: thiol reductant ABC exporter subunit CydC [Halomonadaceae bacterium]